MAWLITFDLESTKVCEVCKVSKPPSNIYETAYALFASWGFHKGKQLPDTTVYATKLNFWGSGGGPTIPASVAFVKEEFKKKGLILTRICLVEVADGLTGPLIFTD